MNEHSSGRGLFDFSAKSQIYGATMKTPLLLQGAIPRTGDPVIPGGYSVDSDTWEVDGQPLVASASQLSSLLTKTDAPTESDDHRTPALLEMLTKTKVELEGDDDRFSLSGLELMTKTMAKTERDD
ncbi:hypothetical protein [Solimonas sp. SE-A11]|uniref:hypothetical protein n=1 Tax=Solimonas sp. SE-A11 TaxID=3054954 RepID=UPI00259CE497|nr:hypothetical protein [Solimonas sp. SE-A11]MDM4771174.1 hypothetical protein [Solimonas sp. SE-A11]